VVISISTTPPMADGDFQTPSRQAQKHSPRSSPPSSAFAVIEPDYDEPASVKSSFPMRIWESFKRDPCLNTTQAGTIGADGRLFDVEGAAQATANSPLARKLKGRHLQMIAIGGSIGRENLPIFVFIPNHSQEPVFSSALGPPWRTAVRHHC
jgi:hypothetical protein